MNLMQTIFMDIVLILFPLLAYLFYLVYSNNLDRKENNLFLDLSLVTSLYLVISFGYDYSYNIPIIIYNIPLAIAYIKKRHLTILFLSLSLILYLSLYYKLSLILLIIEYLIYYLIFVFKSKKVRKELTFLIYVLFVKIIFYVIYVLVTEKNPNIDIFNVLEIFSCLVLFVGIIYFSIILFKKCEEISKLHMNLKELQKEKTIRRSLFKITHEIKNPIAVCKGYLDMFDIHNNEHSRKYIPIIKEEINRTLTLLQDFLSLDNIKINKDILDINLLLDESIKSFAPLLKDKNIVGCFDISDDEVFVYGDYNRLTQVVINIIQNSVEAMQGDKVNFIKIYTKVDNKYIKIYFEDNGCGMNKEQLRKLEEPFFTTKVKGTGLGVYLSREIVKAHGGTLKYKSKENYGTTAILKLPLYSY